MKDESINFRATTEEKQMIAEAAINYEQRTGRKSSQSRVIIHAVEQLANAEPQLFFVNREAIKKLDEMTEYCRVNLQAFVTEFFTATGMNISLDQMQTCFINIGKLGSKALIQQAIDDMVKHMLFEKLAAKHDDIIITEDNIPQKDLSSLFVIAERLDHVPTIQIGAPETIFWVCFTLSDGKISVNESEVERMKTPYRSYAATAPELKKLAMVRKLCKAMNDICEDPDFIPSAIWRLVFFDTEARRYEPTGAWIKHQIEPTKILFKH